MFLLSGCWKTAEAVGFMQAYGLLRVMEVDFLLLAGRFPCAFIQIVLHYPQKGRDRTYELSGSISIHRRGLLAGLPAGAGASDRPAGQAGGAG